MVSDWEAELVRIRQESEWLAERLSDEQFTWRPGPERWSVGECFDHLAIATGLMVTKARPEVERGRRAGVTGAGPFRYGMIGGWFVSMMEKPPGKRRMPSPGNFVPASGAPRAQVLRKYFAALDDFAGALKDSQGLALDKLKAASSAKGGAWLRLNLAAWYAATLAHLRRHLAQAKRVTETEGFPAR
jgi:hypothetical protein